MFPRRMMITAAVVLGVYGLVGTTSARAQSPEVDSAARQRFVSLLTGVRPNAKAKPVARPASKGNLRAFAPRGQGSPYRI